MSCFVLFLLSLPLFVFFTVIVLLLSCSPINAPVSSSFAGALRMINVSGSASSALMPRPLNSANYTESFSGVRFAQVLPRVRKIYCDLLLNSFARTIPTDCAYPILMRRSDPHISRHPTETNCKDHKSEMMQTFVVDKISGKPITGSCNRKSNFFDDNANPRTVSYIACSSSVFYHKAPIIGT